MERERYMRLLIRIFTIFFIISLAVSFILPLFWMLSGSFKLQTVTMIMPPEFIPENPTLGNWDRLFTGPWPVWRWVLNSIAVSLLTVFLVLLVASMTGYGFGKKKFPGSKILFIILLTTMFLPNQVMLIPLFLLVRSLGLAQTVLGTFFAMALPIIPSPFGVFLIKQFCTTIPDELLDAARIDGASEFGIYFRIALPLLRPALAALAIFTFNQAWNNFMWHMVLASDKFYYTIPVGISYIARTPSFGKMVTDIGLSMAGGTFGELFMIMFFLMFQRYFVKGITFGAVKG
jgi:multiple sugar transport system permease protein